MSYAYVAMWPILDDDLTVRQLAEEAWPDMRILAAEAGARITGPPSWSVGVGPGGTAVLYGHAAAAAVAGRAPVVPLRTVEAPGLGASIGIDEHIVAALLGQGVTVADLAAGARKHVEDVALKRRHIGAKQGEDAA